MHMVLRGLGNRGEAQIPGESARFYHDCRSDWTRGLVAAESSSCSAGRPLQACAEQRTELSSSCLHLREIILKA